MTNRAVSKDDVKAFADFCVRIRSFYQHFRILFEFTDDDEKRLLHQTAPIFFGDLNLILIEHLILQICKVTDPETTFGNENHTIEFFVSNADFSATPAKLDRLIDLSKMIHEFRNKLKLARDKIISHLDRNTMLDRKTLGAATKKEWDEFWLNLQDFVFIMHDHFLAEPLAINDVAMLSDADSLIKALRHATYFDKLLRDADPAVTKKCFEIAFRD
ncbi:MAG: hypothetical protein KGJ66_09550 [Alphaproteobacteria bacterium]|nr:hypothetical protein [Alphaproteobacteria bacterium]